MIEGIGACRHLLKILLSCEISLTPLSQEFQDLCLLPHVGVHVLAAPRPGHLHQGGHHEGPGVQGEVRLPHRVLHQ